MGVQWNCLGETPLCPEQRDALTGRQSSGPFCGGIMVVGLLSQVLGRQAPCGRFGYHIGPGYDHDVHEAMVIFYVPFNCASVSGLCVTLDPFYLSVYPLG